MVKRIELGTSYIIPKGVLGFYTTQLFWIFEEKKELSLLSILTNILFIRCAEKTGNGVKQVW